MRIVYDASARATPNSPSLNDCLYSGPPLHNRLWDVLVQQRAYPVVLARDIQKAFLQIRIHESERDTLRFHWQTDGTSEVETYRFTRVLFELGPSPFLLGGVLEYHFDSWAQRYPEEAERLRRSFYVDDLLTGGQNEQQTKARKEIAQEIMSDATFKRGIPTVQSLKKIAANKKQKYKVPSLKRVKRAPTLPQKPKSSRTPSNSCKSSQVNQNY